MSKKIVFLDEKNNIILRSELTELQLDENYILNESMKRFNDPEPCIIYRSYIIKKFYIEFYDFINNFNYGSANNVFVWSKVPNYIKDAIKLSKIPFTFTVNK